MDWTIIGVNFLYAALGVALMWLSYRLFDPRIRVEGGGQ